MVKYGGKDFPLGRLSKNSTQPKSKSSMLSISSTGRLSKNSTQPKSSMLSISSFERLSKNPTLRKQTKSTTSTKNRKRVRSHVFERNLFKSRQKYLEYLLESIFDLIQNKTPVVSTNYNNMSARFLTMLGGDIKKIVSIFLAKTTQNQIYKYCFVLIIYMILL